MVNYFAIIVNFLNTPGIVEIVEEIVETSDFISKLLQLGDLSDAEVAEIMDAHQREMADAMKRQDRERDEKMNALRKKLAERRRKREAALKAKHAQEVRLI